MSLLASDLVAYLEALKRGEVIACPTETQMGLLADALDDAAVMRVCALKQRPASEAIGLLVPSLDVALELVEPMSPLALSLAREHWPGPLTLVLRARAGLPTAIVKDGTVALRVPGSSPAAEIVSAFGGPLTATSANLSGSPVLADARELRATFGAGLAAIVPGAPPGGPPSTLVDATGPRPVVLRVGSLTIEGG
jgi:L-threonylcarbamoyladenylate synthase